jgi:DNA-binding response OmpR family regulator
MSAGPGGEYEILLIEGDPDILWLTQKALTFHGYAAIAAATLQAQAATRLASPVSALLYDEHPQGQYDISPRGEPRA